MQWLYFLLLRLVRNFELLWVNWVTLERFNFLKKTLILIRLTFLFWFKIQKWFFRRVHCFFLNQLIALYRCIRIFVLICCTRSFVLKRLRWISSFDDFLIALYSFINFISLAGFVRTYHIWEIKESRDLHVQEVVLQIVSRERAAFHLNLIILWHGFILRILVNLKKINPHRWWVELRECKMASGSGVGIGSFKIMKQC